MDPIIVDTDAQLADAGGYLALSGTIDLASYDVGPLHYRIADGLSYDVTLSNTGGAIFLLGHITGIGMGECARCLEPASFDIDAEPEAFFLLPGTDPTELDLAEDEYVEVSDKDTIDLAPAFSAALVYATPQMLLCKPDCKGLCPHCGSDLNKGDCNCADQVDDVDEMNPFNVLKGYFDEDPPKDS